MERALAGPAQRGSQVFALLALFAIASTSIIPLSNPDFVGWRLDHGHISLTAGTPEHTHAWEHEDRHAHSAGDQFADNHSADNVVTTDGGLGSVPGPGVAWAPTAFAITLGAALEAWLTTAVPTPSIEASPSPLTPPPRL